MILNADKLVTILICSHLGIAGTDDALPFTTREWNILARSLQNIGLRPGDLMNISADDLSRLLEQKDGEYERVSSLLGRANEIENELGRLEAQGISVLTRSDNEYPQRYKQRLKEAAPVLLYYAGESALLGQPGIAVVGSRNLDDAGIECSKFIGNACGLAGSVLYSGGARGVDSISMNAALEARGTAVGILADSLEKAIRTPEYRKAIEERNLCLASPYSPSAPFTVGGAMGRNRLIYTLADFAIIVASDYQKGGTWTGANEALKAGWLPVFALDHAHMPLGNKKLIEKGAIPFPHPFPYDYTKLMDWLSAQSPVSQTDNSEQLSLFQ